MPGNIRVTCFSLWDVGRAAGGVSGKEGVRVEVPPTLAAPAARALLANPIGPERVGSERIGTIRSISAGTTRLLSCQDRAPWCCSACRMCRAPTSCHGGALPTPIARARQESAAAAPSRVYRAVLLSARRPARARARSAFVALAASVVDPEVRRCRRHRPCSIVFIVRVFVFFIAQAGRRR